MTKWPAPGRASRGGEVVEVPYLPKEGLDGGLIADVQGQGRDLAADLLLGLNQLLLGAAGDNHRGACRHGGLSRGEANAGAAADNHNTFVG